MQGLGRECHETAHLSTRVGNATLIEQGEEGGVEDR
jgi:hypothetical protein